MLGKGSSFPYCKQAVESLSIMEGRVSRTGKRRIVNTRCFGNPRSNGLSRVLWHMHLLPALEKQRQVNLSEFKPAKAI